MKNILHIIPSKVWGGGEQYIYDLSSQIKNSNNYTIYLIGRKSTVLKEKFSNIGQYHILPLKSAFDIYSIIKIGRFLSKNKIDIVNVHIFKDAFMIAFAIHLFRLKNIKLIMTRHLVRKGKFGALYKWLYNQLNTLIFVSETAKRAFLSTCPENFSFSNITVILNAIPLTRINDNGSNESYDWINQIPEDSFKIGYIGRIDPEKGLETVLKCAQELKNDNRFVFMIAGTGNKEYLNELHQYIKNNNLKNVIFTGFMNQTGDFIKLCDIGLLPSIVPEACPLSIIEFLSLSKPVIASNNGAQTEMINDGIDGFLVCPQDYETIIKKIHFLYTEAEREKTADAAYKKSLSFTYDKFFRKIMSVYNENS